MVQNVVTCYIWWNACLFTSSLVVVYLNYWSAALQILLNKAPIDNKLPM